MPTDRGRSLTRKPSRTIARVQRDLKALGWFVVLSDSDSPFEIIAMPSAQSRPIAGVVGTAKPPAWVGVAVLRQSKIPADELRHLAQKHGGIACFAQFDGILEP